MVMSERLRRERASLKLVCECECCEHFVEDSPPDGACDLLYPTPPHRRAAFDNAKDGDPIFFCKMFEAR